MEQESPAPSDRQFVFTFAVVSTILIFVFRAHMSALYFAALSFTLTICGFMCAKKFHGLNRLWHRFGLFLSWLVTPIMLTLVYFLIIAPTGILLGIFGHTSMALKGKWISKDKKNNRYYGIVDADGKIIVPVAYEYVYVSRHRVYFGGYKETGYYRRIGPRARPGQYRYNIPSLPSIRRLAHDDRMR